MVDEPVPGFAEKLKPSTSTVSSAAIGVPLGIVVVWALHEFAGVDMPSEVAAATGSLVGALVGYFFYGGRSHETV
jgi:uncharacterized membrane protein YfcA